MTIECSTYFQVIRLFIEQLQRCISAFVLIFSLFLFVAVGAQSIRRQWRLRGNEASVRHIRNDRYEPSIECYITVDVCGCCLVMKHFMGATGARVIDAQNKITSS